VCDDGDAVDGGGCAADCMAIEPGFRCSIEGGGCREPGCGDFVVDVALGESCDDANDVSGDGCDDDIDSLSLTLADDDGNRVAIERCIRVGVAIGADNADSDAVFNSQRGVDGERHGDGRTNAVGHKQRDAVDVAHGVGHGHCVHHAELDGELGAELDDEPLGVKPAKTGRKWSPEAKAAAAAKRAAKKAGGSAVTTTSSDADGDGGATVSAVKQAPPSPKVSASVSNAAASSSASVSNAAPASSVVFKPVLLSGGARYFVNMENGHAYHRLSDGSQGEWAGIFKRDPKPRIDDSVPEPTADGDDDGELCFD
jgi:hypothetical protein